VAANINKENKNCPRENKRQKQIPTQYQTENENTTECTSATEIHPPIPKYTLPKLDD
jgi:hypothetical protein